MAYFQANTNYESILADIYAGAVSNPGSVLHRPRFPGSARRIAR